MPPQCGDDGWCTVLELKKPYEGAWLGSMWASGPSDIFAVGRYTIAHYDGLRWQLQPNHATSAIYDISGSGPDDVYVVGSWRTFQRYDGKRWRLEHKDTYGTIRTTHVNGVMVFARGKACATSGNYRFWCREADGTWARVRSRKRRGDLAKAFQGRHGGDRKKLPAEATVACAPEGVADTKWCGTTDYSVVECKDGRGFVIRDVGKLKQTTPLGKLPTWLSELPLERECVVTGDWIYANGRTWVFRRHLGTKK